VRNGGHVVHQIADSLLHTGFDVGLDFLHGLERMRAGFGVSFQFSYDKGADVFLPFDIRIIFPVVFKLKTRIGSRFNRAHGDGRGIHHAEVLGQDLQVAHLGIHHGVGERSAGPCRRPH